MKSKHLLLTLLLALLVPWAAMAQGTLTIGNGTSFSTGSNSSSSFTPGSVLGNTYYYNSITQFIYTASEMGEAKTITSVAFYHNAAGTFTTQNLTIYLAHTTESTISGSTAVTSGTAYYTGTNVTLGGDSEGWQVFQLDTDFEYNGTDNLLVVVARNSSSGYKTAQGWQYTSTANDYRYIVRSSDTQAYGVLSNDNSTYAYSQSYNRPNIQIGFQTTDPYITLDPTSATVITGSSTTITATYGNVTNPTITYTSSNEGVATVSGSGTTATVTGVAAGTATITATLNGAASATCAITVEDPSYCTPSFGSNNDCITNITLGDINNTTASTSTNGYGDYTNLSTDLEQNEPATLSLTSGGGSGTHAAAVWIDFNDNYTFDDSERVGTKDGIGASATVTINLTISSDATPGSHRMRVVYQYNVSAANINPCASANYGEGEDYTVTILAANPCQKPTNLSETQVGTTTAVLNWEGESDSYVLHYRTAAHDNMNLWEQVGEDIIGTATLTQYTFDLSNYSGTGNIAIRHYNVSDMFRVAIDDIVVTNANSEEVVNEGFEDAVPSDWVIVDYDGDGNNWGRVSFGDTEYQNGSYCMSSESWSQSYGALNPDNWLIITNVELGGTLTFYMRGVDATFPQENIGVFVTTSSLETVFGTTPASEWSADISVATTSHKLTGLTANTEYEWQVKGICGEIESNWASSSFTTIAEGFKTFISEGNWDVADNWFPEGVPTITDEVSIEAPVTIPAGVIATAKRADLNGGSILIKDGGQLKQGAATLRVTLEKEITGVGQENWNNEEYKGGWNFISSPFSGRTLYQESGTWSRVENLLTGDYDLYAFDPERTAYWINYKEEPSHISFESSNGNAGLMYGEGYLYASQEDRTLNFVGTTGKSINYTETIDYTYDGTATYEFNGWKLVGNYFSCNAYINYLDADNNVLNADFYVMNGNGDGYTLSESGVGLAPCTGAFINVEATGKIQYSTEVPDNTTIYNRALNMTVSNGRSSVDMARVRFGRGHNLKHMSFRQNSSKLYIPQDNDYAVVYSEENQGEMPVSFKAETNGTYTLGFNTKNVEFSYLHLIDNMTGNDVNLLETPSYTFEARTTDYASRFRLVFAANNNSIDETFAFISDGNIILTGEGMLQVVDIMGRVISQEENATRVATNGMTPGVYVLRLINGDNVRTQKIVVK